MNSTKSLAFLFLCTLLTSLATPILGCGYCGDPTHKHKPKPKPSGGGGGKGGHSHPIIPTKPPGGGTTVPTVPIPPISIPPITVPPVLNPPSTSTPTPSGKPCPPGPIGPITPSPPDSCPIDALKLGACVDLLGGLIHIGLGDPVKDQCCPILHGLVEAEAAVCLCTTLKLKLLNLNLYVPLALQLLLTCGQSPPPGFTCTL